jgi:hypothetical protein
MFLEPGQKVSLDVSGLRLPNVGMSEACADGVVVDVAPGVITVRLELEDGERLVTVSPNRIG